MDPMGIYVYIYIIYILSTSKYLQPRMYLMVSSSTSIKKKTKPPHPSQKGIIDPDRPKLSLFSLGFGVQVGGWHWVGGLVVVAHLNSGFSQLSETFRDFTIPYVFQKKLQTPWVRVCFVRRKGRSFWGLNRGGSIRESSRWVQPHPRMNEFSVCIFPY